jgi:NAD(P)H dehydrogenase (quinone)
VAALLSAYRGEAIRFHDETVPEAYASREHWGAPDWQVDAWVSTYLAIASGDLAAVSTDVERVTGRPATSLAELLAAS